MKILIVGSEREVDKMSGVITRLCSMGQYAMLLMLQNPAMKLFEARKRARGTKRVKFSKHVPHYGKQAAARNLRHAKAWTHGLMRIDNKILFG